MTKVVCGQSSDCNRLMAAAASVTLINALFRRMALRVGSKINATSTYRDLITSDFLVESPPRLPEHGFIWSLTTIEVGLS